MNLDSDKLHDAALAELTGAGQLLELTELSKPWGSQPVFRNAPKTLGDYFAFMLQHADKTFLVFGEERYTFSEVWVLANRIASALQAVGIEKGDRVAIAMRNYPEWILAFMGISLAGGIVVPLNSWWKGVELQQAIDDSGSRFAFVDEERDARLADAGSSITRVVVRANTARREATDFEDFLQSAKDTPQSVDVDTDDDATIFYTSGSTSYPKGVVSTHRALTNTMLNYAAHGLAQQSIDRSLESHPSKPSRDEQPATLLTVPLFHVTGCHSIFMISVLIGRKIVLLEKWDAGKALAMIERERVTTFMGVPTMSRELTEHPAVEKYDISSLTEINAGGAARPEDHLRRLQARFPDLKPGMAYGLTETNGTGAVNSREGYLSQPQSTGRAMRPLAELAILDEDGTSKAGSGEGEIAVRSITLARGYWGKPEETAQAFQADGWFRTGDLGYLKDGYLTIVGRKKDMILRGGENIACQEVEAAMMADSQVMEACVFSVPDDRLGEAVRAVVYVQDASAFNEDQHRRLLESSLAAFKHPKVIVTVAEPLPRLGSGKIDKLTVKSEFSDAI
ncbi:MAG: class I adenylate-forming enzyme family protein [Pseudomonadota bacterium]